MAKYRVSLKVDVEVEVFAVDMREAVEFAKSNLKELNSKIKDVGLNYSYMLQEKDAVLNSSALVDDETEFNWKIS